MDGQFTVDGRTYTLETIGDLITKTGDASIPELERLEYKRELSALQLYSNLASAAAMHSIAQSAEIIAHCLQNPRMLEVTGILDNTVDEPKGLVDLQAQHPNPILNRLRMAVANFNPPKPATYAVNDQDTVKVFYDPLHENKWRYTFNRDEVTEAQVLQIIGNGKRTDPSKIKFDQ